MSLPNELREQLLSGYLDDALSADERARAEQLLASDPEFAAELEELRDIRAMLKTIAGEDEVKLGSGFANQILDAAVAQARSEGLDDNHPLLRLAEQPSLPRRKHTMNWRIPATIVALAASIALAIFAFGPDNNPGPIAEDLGVQNEAVAEVTPDASTTDSVPTAVAMEDSSSDPVSPDSVPQDTVPEELFNGTPSDSDPTTPMLANSDSDVSVPRVVSDPAVDSSPPPSSVVQTPLDDQLLLGGSPVLVYSVRLTPTGKENDAISKALMDAQIGATRQRTVTDEIAGFVSDENDVEAGAGAKVLYLQAPLKNLDRFYLSLMADEQGVSQVGMTIAFNAPIKRLVEALKVEPTLVRHDGRLLELVSETSAVSQLASELDQLPYDFQRNTSLKIQNDGPDEMGQVLVLIQE